MTPDPAEVPDQPAPEAPDRPGRRRRWVGAGVVVAVVAAGAVVLAVLWSRSGAEQVDVDRAAVPTGSSLPSVPAVLRPPQGVYLYTGSGTDRLDKPPKEQSQGPEMPGTVTHRADGCWTFRIDYSTAHWQSWDYCPRDGGLDEAGGSTYQRWDFVAFVNESTSTFTCPDSPTIKAVQRPGQVWRQTCRGTTTGTEGVTTSSGPYRYVGEETLDVGGAPVRSFHYLRQRTNSGNQTGTERSDVWFSAETGLPVRNRRQLQASTDTVIGAVVYTEEGEFELASPEPRR